MTIPIRPGPWSFLQTLGEGVAGAVSAKRKYETEERAKASSDLMSMLDLYSKGVLKKLDTDVIVDLGQRAGIGDFLTNNVVPRPQNTMAEAQNEALGAILPQVLQGGSQYGKEQIAQGNVPTVQGQAESAEKTGRAQVRGQALATTDVTGAPSAIARRVAEVPSESTAVAAEAASTDPFYGNVGERSVDATMTQLKVAKLDSSNMSTVSDQAWQLAQTDARSRGFTLNEELTRPYIDAAVQSRLRQQEEREIKALRANRDTNADFAGLYQKQAQRVNDAIRSLPVPSEVDKAFAGTITRIARESKRTVDQVLADPATPAESKRAYTAVQAYDKTLAQLQAEARAIGDNITQYLGQRIGVPDPSAVPAPSERRGGAGASFESPTPPDAQGNEMKAKKTARYKELVAAEMKKPPAQRKPQADILAQIDREFAASPINLKTYGREKPKPKPKPEVARPQQERSDTPTRGASR